MTIDKVIKAELTPTESKTLQEAINIIDNLINQMEEERLSTIFTDYDGFSTDDLEEIAKNLHSLTTLNEAN